MLLRILCKSSNRTGPPEEVTSPPSSLAILWSTRFPALCIRKKWSQLHHSLNKWQLRLETDNTLLRTGHNSSTKTLPNAEMDTVRKANWPFLECSLYIYNLHSTTKCQFDLMKRLTNSFSSPLLSSSQFTTNRTKTE